MAKKTHVPATSWEHRGVKITFDGHASRPEFIAQAPGKSLKAPSLDAIKKKIDQLSVDTAIRQMRLKTAQNESAAKSRSKVARSMP